MDRRAFTIDDYRDCLQSLGEQFLKVRYISVDDVFNHEWQHTANKGLYHPEELIVFNGDTPYMRGNVWITSEDNYFVSFFITDKTPKKWFVRFVRTVKDKLKDKPIQGWIEPTNKITTAFAKKQQLSFKNAILDDKMHLYTTKGTLDEN